MKKLSLLLFIALQAVWSCATDGSNQEIDNSYQIEKPSKRDFTHLNDDQPKIASSKRINPSESSYPGNGLSRKYVLKNPETPETEIKHALNIDIPNIESSMIDNQNEEEDGGFVTSENLDDPAKSGEDDEDTSKEPSSEEKEKYSGYYKIGNPYKIDGITYYPEKYDNFEEVGLASWYGSEFDGKATANGEIYHMQDFTAAHRTLPLPSMVKITNLSNGKSVIARVNDRGPFASNRVIDVSEKVAESLGFKGKGTTTVKVQFLKKETRDLLVKINKDKNEQLQK